MPPRRHTPRLLLKKSLFAIVATVLFFGVVELALVGFGVSAVGETRDPFAGFAQVPLFTTIVDDRGEELLTTADSKLVWFNSQTFPRHKEPGMRRVFCLGGSTTYGRPYWDGTSYSAWLRELLPLVDPTSNWEVVNAGGVSYASYRVAAVMEELAEYEPDLFVVYSAHNEFLERRTYGDMFDKPPLQIRLASILSRTRTWAVLDRTLNANRQPETRTASEIPPDEVDEILNHTVGPSDYHRDPKWTRDIIQHYEINLRRMVSLARKADAEIVFVAPASNIKDSSPFKSEPLRILSEAESDELVGYLGEAKAEFRNQQYDAALTQLAAARAIDRGYAEVEYWRGKALFATGRFEEAQAAFDAALQMDICPLRALPEMTKAIRRVASDERVTVVEFGEHLIDRCQADHNHRCVGYEYFLDHVHPTIEVHQQLAQWIIDELQQDHVIGGSKPTIDMLLDATEKIEGRVDAPTQGVAMRNLAKLLHWSGKFDEAAHCAADALTLIEGDLESQFLLAECLRQIGQQDEAMQEFELLFDLDPNYDRGYIPFGILLVEQGHLTAAKVYLAMAVALYPDREDAFFALGQAHFDSDEFDLALEALTEATRIKPDDPAIRDLLNRTNARLAESSSEPVSSP